MWLYRGIFNTATCTTYTDFLTDKLVKRGQLAVISTSFCHLLLLPVGSHLRLLLVPTSTSLW